MQEGQALSWEGDRGSYLCVTLGASKPSLGPASCAASLSHLRSLSPVS